MRKATLEISTWMGILPGANDYKGNLIVNAISHPVRKTLTKKEAFKLNIYDKKGNWHLKSDYKAGDSTSRFISEEDLIEAALKFLWTKFPEVVILFKGNASVVEPQEVIWADLPQDVIKELNELYVNSEDTNWYEFDYGLFDRNSDRWEELSVLWQ